MDFGSLKKKFDALSGPNKAATVAITLMIVWFLASRAGLLGIAPWTKPSIINLIPTNWSLPGPIIMWRSSEELHRKKPEMIDNTAPLIPNRNIS